MKRFQIHLSIEGLQQNIDSYSTVFGPQPTVQQDGHAKWMLDDIHSPIEEPTGAVCRYGRSDKYWAFDSQGIPCPSFHLLSEIPAFNDKTARSDGENPYALSPAGSQSSPCRE